MKGSVPRTRGDEPDLGLMAVYLHLCSPHPRG